MPAQKSQTTYNRVVGGVLANYRQRLNIDQAKLASELGMSQASWSRIERGKTAINMSQISKASAYFGISPTKIIEQADQMVKELQKRGITVLHEEPKDDTGKILLGLTALIGIATLLFSED